MWSYHEKLCNGHVSHFKHSTFLDMKKICENLQDHPGSGLTEVDLVQETSVRPRDQESARRFRDSTIHPTGNFLSYR